MKSPLKFLFLTALSFTPASARADGRSYNTTGTLDWVTVEERRPYVQAGNWSPFLGNGYAIQGEEGSWFDFYTGVGNRPDSFWHWSTWPIMSPVSPGDALKIDYLGQFTTGHDGGYERSEGTSAGMTASNPPFASKVNVWYRFALRCWRPADGTPHKGYAGEWIRDGSTGEWYHCGTYEIPFAVTGVPGMGGFIEGYYPTKGAKELHFRSAYVHELGKPADTIQSASTINISFNALTSENPDYKGGYAGLSDDGTYAIASSMNLVTSDPLGNSRTPNVAGTTKTLTISQSATPPFDPIVVSSPSAQVLPDQVLVEWSVPAVSSPQLGYRLEVFNNASCTGTPAVTCTELIPQRRRKLLAIPGVTTPKVRLTVIDIFDRESSPILLTPVTPALKPASNPGSVVAGLNFQYYEAAAGTNWTSLPAFSSLSPTIQGAADFVDTSPRRRRENYAFRHQGYIQVPADGLYIFTLQSFGSSKLLIDGVDLVNYDGLSQPGESSGWIALAAGKHTVEAQYAFAKQWTQTKYGDGVSVMCEGPGISRQPVPDAAWLRIPATGTPTVTLNSPAPESRVTGSSVPLTATVTANGATVLKVQYLMGPVLLGESATAPSYPVNVFLGAADRSLIRARVIYGNGAGSLDSSPQTALTVVNMDTLSWKVSSIGTQHHFPTGGKSSGATLALTGDSFNTITRLVTGDCTLIAHLADIDAQTALQDGTLPNNLSGAGIILRGSLLPNTGAPLGGNEATTQFAAVFGTSDRQSHYQNGTMQDAGGAYSSTDQGDLRWFKLVRTGDTFESSLSADGVTWSVKNTVTLPGIGATLNAGVFQYTPTNLLSYIPHARFDSVSLTGANVDPVSAVISPGVAYILTGQNLTLASTVNGRPPYSSQWRKNGADILGANGGSLVLTNIGPADAGDYSLVFTADNGSVTSAPVTVTVLSSATPYTGEVFALGPIAHWRLDETTGPVLSDFAGDRDGTGQTGLTYAAGSVDTAPFMGFEPSQKALSLDGSASSVVLPPLNLTSNAVTITGWVKRSGDQPAEAGLFITREGGSQAGLQLSGSNSLKYIWNNAFWPWDSGLTLPDNQWVFVAMAVSAGKTTLYLGTDTTLKSASLSGNHVLQSFSGTTRLGWDTSGSDRRFKGLMSSFSVFGQTLTEDQIRALRDAALVSHGSITLNGVSNGATFTTTVLNLGASVSPTETPVQKIVYRDNGTVIGTSTDSPYNFTWRNIPPGSHSLTAQLFYNNGTASTQSPAVGITVNPPPLQSGWSMQDVGTVNQPGTGSSCEGAYILTGGGSDIWGTSDSFSFACQQVTGDCEIRAKVTSLTNTHEWARAGVMIRESLDADSRHMDAFITPGHGFNTQYRSSTGGNTTQAGGPALNPVPDNWVKLTRIRSQFTSWTSADGVTWTQMFSTTIPMGRTVFIGLPVCGLVKNTAGATIATFDRVSVAALPTPWKSGEVGTTGIAGGAIQSGDVIRVNGTGSDIWNTLDSFHFSHQVVTGDCDIRARVLSQTNTHEWARAGVMIRESLAPDSRHMDAFITPGHGFCSQYRSATAGTSGNAQGPALNAAPDNWVRLTRVGNLFSSYASADGVTWTPVTSATISMTSSVCVGLIACSLRQNLATTAEFDHVSLVALPSPWITADIGACGVTGSASQLDNVFSINAGGSDIWGYNDSFRYVWQPATGDCEIRARVTGVTRTHEWAKGGIMIRESQLTNSPHVSIYLAADPAHGVSWQTRSSSSDATGAATDSGIAPPVWLRLTRTGSVFQGFRSADGVNWTSVYSISIPMSTNVCIGLAGCSLDTGNATTASFDNVTVIP